ncbi:MAG TPA: peptidoglycan-binding protein LysM [Eubacteriaceae bacterium]|nr:peptidoglycan-binding protein LysM [Eubacteriaceae bacterium]
MRTSRLVIVNKKRFIMSIVVFIGVIALAVSAVSLTKVQAQEEVIFETYTVEQGDVLWDIAKTYKDEKQDIREFIYQIMKHNNIKNETAIQPNQVLFIPIT